MEPGRHSCHQVKDAAHHFAGNGRWKKGDSIIAAHSAVIGSAWIFYGKSMKALLLFLSMLLVVIMALAGFLWFDGDRVRRQGKNPMQGDDIHVYFVGKIDTEGHRYYLTNIDPESIRQCLDKHSMD